MDIEKFQDFLDDEQYEYMDVVIDGNKFCAVLYEENWYLLPVTFKFEGIPYLSCEPKKTTKEYLDTLEKW